MFNEKQFKEFLETANLTDEIKNEYNDTIMNIINSFIWGLNNKLNIKKNEDELYYLIRDKIYKKLQNGIMEK